MAWDPEFLELMPATVGFRAKTSNDRYNKKAFATAEPSRARLTFDIHEVSDVEGETRTAAGNVWTPPPGAADGPVTLPTTDGLLVLPSTAEVAIIKVEQVEDEDGLHHLKVHFG